jgi:hypothetical protein
MPQLSKDMAEKTAEAESNFELVPENTYILVLKEDPAVKEGPNGPYWSWVFEIPQGEEFAGRRFWNNTSLGDNALWKLNETFAAFGVPTSTNTEDLIGRRVKAVIVQEVQEKGKNAGELQNTIKTLLPAEPKDGAPAASGPKSKPKDDVPLY